MNLASDEEIGELEMAFKQINRSNSGIITLEEVWAAFEAETEEAKELVTQIFHEVDIDRSGKVELTEWIVAAIDKRSLI